MKERWGLDMLHDENSSRRCHARMSLQTWWPQRVSCRRRGITQGSKHVTVSLCFCPPLLSSPSCAPLFMSWSRPLFFFLNNWLEARPEVGWKSACGGGLGKLETRFSPCWLVHWKMAIKHSFPRFSSDSPLTWQRGSFPLQKPAFLPFYSIQVHICSLPLGFFSAFCFSWCSFNPSSDTCQAVKNKMLNGGKKPQKTHPIH